jgi:hypothetical protein
MDETVCGVTMLLLVKIIGSTEFDDNRLLTEGEEIDHVSKLGE